MRCFLVKKTKMLHFCLEPGVNNASYAFEGGRKEFHWSEILEEGVLVPFVKVLAQTAKPFILDWRAGNDRVAS